MLGRRRAGHGADVGEARRARLAELGDQRGQALPQRLAALQAQVHQVGGAGVGGPDEHEHARARRPRASSISGRSASRPSSGLAVSASARRPGTAPNGVGVAPVSAWPYAAAVTGTSPRLPSARTSSPAARACAQTPSSASAPGKPRRSKRGELRLDGHAGGPGGVDQRDGVGEDGGAGLERGRVHGEVRADGGLLGGVLAGRTARARRRARRRAPAPGRRGARTSGRAGPATAGRGRDRSRGRSATRAPRQRRRAGRRTAMTPGRAPASHRRRPTQTLRRRLLDGLLEARPGGEPRHAARGDGHRLARPRVAALAGPAVGDVELAEAREADLVTGLAGSSSIESITASTAAPASFLLRPLLAATLSTNSAFVVMTTPPFPQHPGDLDDGANLTASSDALEPNSDFPRILREFRTLFQAPERRCAAEMRRSAASRSGPAAGSSGSSVRGCPPGSVSTTRGSRAALRRASEAPSRRPRRAGAAPSACAGGGASGRRLRARAARQVGEHDAQVVADQRGQREPPADHDERVRAPSARRTPRRRPC